MSATPRNSNRTRQETLFDQFVDVLVKMTEPGEDGSPPNPGAPMLGVIRQFIKDQNISADEDRHEGLQKLTGNTCKLPFSEKPREEGT